MSWVRSMTLSSEKFGDGAHLGGAELGVEHQQVDALLQGLDDQFRELALAHEKAGVEAGPALQDGGRHVKAGGAGQFRQLRQGILGRRRDCAR